MFISANVFRFYWLTDGTNIYRARVWVWNSGFASCCSLKKLGCHTSIVIKHCLVYASTQCIFISFKCKWKWKWGRLQCISKMLFNANHIIISHKYRKQRIVFPSTCTYIFISVNNEHICEPIQLSVWYQCLECDFFRFCFFITHAQ